MMTQEKKIKVLFVCLGNVCRSPIAEGVFQKTVNKMNLGDKWEINSAGIQDWHIGKPPKWKAINTLKKHGIPYSNRARQIVADDFNYYDYIIGMDEENVKDLIKKAPSGCRAKLLLFGEFDPHRVRNIRDPYFDSDPKGFENCYEQSLRCTNGFLESLLKQK